MGLIIANLRSYINRLHALGHTSFDEDVKKGK